MAYEKDITTDYGTVRWCEEADIVFTDDGDEIETGVHVTISLVRVSDDRRGEGLGTKLMQDALDQIRADGYSTVKLAAHPYDGDDHMDDLVRFYERLGFTIDKDQPCAEVFMTAHI